MPRQVLCLSSTCRTFWRKTKPKHFGAKRSRGSLDCCSTRSVQTRSKASPSFLLWELAYDPKTLLECRSHPHLVGNCGVSVSVSASFNFGSKTLSWNAGCATVVPHTFDHATVQLVRSCSILVFNTMSLGGCMWRFCCV
jgi:hypothetical protein